MRDEKPNVEAIFSEALQQPNEAERSALLDRECGGDAQLRSRVEELLRSHQAAEEPSAASGPKETVDFPRTVDPVPAPTPIAEQPGAQIGSYKIRQQMGSGGMGVVYVADQKEPVKRRVALKIIKPGMDSQQVIARFEAERQALALMDHPNIAKVLDAGTTDSGRPFFVMELVNGVPITDYCDQQHLTPRQRLELFVPVCQAVQHAHQKGIIHRDLKPSNILVGLYDGQPVPKVIDFGVAKATSHSLTDKSLFTEFGQVVGTLEYMSPEQAQRSQLDIDTRSDIYSLGVVLYELLAGDTPFDRQRLREAAFDEILRIIREEEPPRPSAKLSTSAQIDTIAANRHVEPGRLSTLVRGELDWIVMKALEKDRARRYESASRFASDVEKYLNDEPVSACPPSLTYRAGKLLRRNKVATALAVAAIVALASVVAAGVATSKNRQIVQANNDLSEANEELAQAKVSLEESLVSESELREDVDRLLYLSRVSSALANFQSSDADRAREILQSCSPKWRDWEWYYVNRLCSSTVQSLEHTGEIRSIRYSADGRKIFTASADGKVWVWNAATGDLTDSWDADGAVRMDIRPDGQRVVTGSKDGVISVWKHSGELVQMWKAHSVLSTVAYSPDGKRIASGGTDKRPTAWEGEAKVWDAQSGEMFFDLAGHKTNVHSVSFRSDGLCISCDDRTLILSDESGDVTATAPFPWAQCFTLSRNGNLIAVAGEEYVYTWSAGERAREFVSLEQGRWVNDVSLNHDGTLLVTGAREYSLFGSAQNSIQLWNTATGEKVMELPGHKSSVAAVEFSPDGQSIASGGSDKIVKVWSPAKIQRESIVHSLGHRVYCVTFNPNGNQIASGTASTLTVLDVDSGETLFAAQGLEGAILAVAYSPDGKRIVSRSSDQSVRVWDAENGSELSKVALPDAVRVSVGGYRCAFNLSRDWVAAASDRQGTAAIWDLRSGSQLRTFTGNSGKVLSFALSADGTRLATGSEDAIVGIWDTQTGEQLFELAGHRRQVDFLTFSPDGKYVCSGSSSKDSARLWEAESGKFVRVLSNEARYVMSVAFSPDGKRIAYGPSNLVKLCDTTSGHETLTLRGHTGVVHSIAFSPDGELLASAGGDGTVRIWQAPRPKKTD